MKLPQYFSSIARARSSRTSWDCRRKQGRCTRHHQATPTPPRSECSCKKHPLLPCETPPVELGHGFVCHSLTECKTSWASSLWMSCAGAQRAVRCRNFCCDPITFDARLSHEGKGMHFSLKQSTPTANSQQPTQKQGPLACG